MISDPEEIEPTPIYGYFDETKTLIGVKTGTQLFFVHENLSDDL
jgi:hypothetical protein